MVSPILGTRGAVLHFSAELVLSFRIHICAFPSSPFQRRTGPVCLQQYSCLLVHLYFID